MPQKRTYPQIEQPTSQKRKHRHPVETSPKQSTRRANTLFATAVSRPDSSKQYLSAGSAGRKFEYGTVTRSQRRGHQRPASLRRANTRSGSRRAVAGFLRQPRAGLEAECSGAGSVSVVVAGPEAHRQRGGTARRGRGARRRAERPGANASGGLLQLTAISVEGRRVLLPRQCRSKGGRIGGRVGMWMDRRVRPSRQYRSKAAESAGGKEGVGWRVQRVLDKLDLHGPGGSPMPLKVSAADEVPGRCVCRRCCDPPHSKSLEGIGGLADGGVSVSGEVCGSCRHAVYQSKRIVDAQSWRAELSTPSRRGQKRTLAHFRYLATSPPASVPKDNRASVDAVEHGRATASVHIHEHPRSNCSGFPG